MKRLLFTLFVFAFSVALFADTAEARGRRRRCKGGRCGAVVPTINLPVPNFFAGFLTNVLGGSK